MRRDEYLADERVAEFTLWVSHLVTGDLTLEHQWRSRGTDFCFASLYDALGKYGWPDNRYSLDHRATAKKLQEFRDIFHEIGVVNSRAKQDQFVANAEDVIRGAVSRFQESCKNGVVCRRACFRP